MKATILSLLGFSPKVVNRLDGASKNQMVFGAFTVWLVASLSALLFATTISNLCFEGNYFWPIAGVWFLFMYALDAIVLGSDLKRRSVMMIRVGICVVLACFHSLTLDTFAFRKDINNYLTTVYNNDVNTLDNSFQNGQAAPLLEAQAGLVARNQELNNAEKTSRDRVFKEVDEGGNGRPPGYGKNARAKDRIYAADSALFAQERVANITEMERLGVEQAVLNTELTNRKAALVKPEAAGLMDNVNALHKLVWGEKGTMSDKFYFLLLGLLGFLLEALVLIAKLSFGRSFSAYHNEVEAERSRVAASQDKKRINEDVIEDLEMTKEFQERTSPMSRDIDMHKINYANDLSKAKAEARFGKVKDDSDMTFTHIKDVDKIDKKMKKDLNGLYEDYGKKLVTENRLERIKKIADDLKNERT